MFNMSVGSKTKILKCHCTIKSRLLNLIFIFFIIIAVMIIYAIQTWRDEDKFERNTLIQPGPIDLVYTWVNGSDPDFLRELDRLKKLDELNSMPSADKCSLKNCIASHFLATRGILQKSVLQDISEAIDVETIKINKNEDWTLISFSTPEAAKRSDGIQIRQNEKVYTCNLVLWTTDSTAKNVQYMNDYIIIIGINPGLEKNDVVIALPWDTYQLYLWIYDYFAVAKISEQNKTQIFNNESYSSVVVGENIAIMKNLYFIITKMTSYIPGEPFSATRYDDKQELRFSLRSVEKFAPWVRHIYLVTNGQIPFWLKVNHPKLTIVTHEQIFVNKSHLPTFNSRAIESHLHRIPGLSNHFLYLNDDFMFGKTVSPQDFYTQENGYKIYGVHDVTRKVEICSPSWIGDGYCDNACNKDLHEWDAGDCKEDQEDLILGRNIRETQNKTNISSVNTNKNFNYNNFNLDEVKTNYLNTENSKNKPFEETNTRIGRKLLFMFEDAIQHVNNLYDKTFGKITRKIPGHIPYYIDKNIMKTLQERFPEEWDATSSHNLRTSNGMQYSFAYFNFLMSEMESLNIEQIFDTFDTDNSGDWSGKELEVIVTKLDTNFSLRKYENYLTECAQSLLSDPDTENFVDYVEKQLNENKIMPILTKDFVVHCEEVSSELVKKFGFRNKYKYELVGGKDSSYIGLKNLNQAKRDFKNLLKNPRKFICINDCLNRSREKETALVLDALSNFYNTFLPQPSSFEQSQPNNFAHISEIRKNQETEIIFQILACIALLFLVILFGCYRFCRVRVCHRVKI